MSGDRLRIELQAKGGSPGDAELLVNGSQFSVYDGANTVYRGTLPRSRATKRDHGAHERRVPSVARIQQAINELAKRVDVTGPGRSSLAGQPAYTVRISPRHDGGMLGASELAFDAVRGIPLSLAVFAQGTKGPVLELAARNITYAPVPASYFDVPPPASARVVELKAPRGDKHKARRTVAGLAAVKAAVHFNLTAPAKLVGLPRRAVKLLDWKGSPAALVVYGQDLGGIAVIEQKQQSRADTVKKAGSRDNPLPTVQIRGATGTELATALGTLLRFDRGGISYTVVGSVPPAAAEAAAREL